MYPVKVEKFPFKICVFDEMAIFIIFSLLIHEHESSLYFLMSFSISFFKVLKFLLYKAFNCFSTVIPRYFILLEAIGKGVIVFIISFSLNLSFVYRNVSDFSQLILYPNALLNVVYQLYLSPSEIYMVTYVYYPIIYNKTN